MNLKNITKFIINLDHRTDRLEAIDKEFKFMEWEYERFPAVNTGCYNGCILSHIEVAKIAKERGLDCYMVFEDDAIFMPYIKKKLTEYNELLDKIEWDMFHFGPAFHSGVKKERKHAPLVHLRNDIIADKHNGGREVLTTHAMLIKDTMYEDLINKGEYGHQPIDEYMSRHLFKKYNCYCGDWPLASQIKGFSDINRTEDNTHYTIIYNWKQYVNNDLSASFYDLNSLKK